MHSNFARMTDTMKLYFTPTSCGAANFLTAQIGGVNFDSEVVDLATHKTASGVDFYTINPKGNVPTLVFPDGSLLNENVAVLTYLADQGSAQLAPKEGTIERYHYLNDLAFVSTEVHSAYGVLFNPTLSQEAREAAVANVQRRLDKLAVMLEGGKNRFLNGPTLSTADLYLYVVLGWSGLFGVTLPERVQSYHDGLKSNEAIAKASEVMASKS